MFPVKDDIATAHAAALAAALAGATVLLGLVGLAPADAWELAVLAAGAALFAPALVAGVPALAALVAGVPAAFAILSGTPQLALAAALGSIVAGYLALFARARFLSLVLIPFYFTLVAVPAAVWALVWFALAAIAWPAAVTALGAGALAGVVLCCTARPLRRGLAAGCR